jgi:alpha/beta superfamily hydrolase
MAEVRLDGPAGAIEGRYVAAGSATAPIALVLHPHPLAGGAMDNPVVDRLCRAFAQRGFSVLCFNFRGVGASEGAFDGGAGELEDAAAALDWLQAQNPGASQAWLAGYSFGAWVALQLLMRRPGIRGFIAVSPPAGHYDLSFLSPCPAPGLILHGSADSIASAAQVEQAVAELDAKTKAALELQVVEGASHFWMQSLDQLTARVGAYLDRRLAAPQDGPASASP